MSLILPDIAGQNEFLQSVIVATGFQACDDNLSQWADRLGRKPLQAPYGTAEGRSWVRLSFLTALRGTVRFDIHLARESYFKGDPPKPSASIEKIQAAIEEIVEKKITGFKTVLFVDGEFVIAQEKLPERGIISAAFGIAMSTAGAELTFTGASMAVSEEPFTELEWKLIRKSENVEVRISAFDVAAIESNFLERAVHTVQDGFDRFVLEKTR